MKVKVLLVLCLFFLASLKSFSNIYTVTNSAGNDWFPACGGAGSLQEAICNATSNPGRDTIEFNLAGGTLITSAKNVFTIDANQSNLYFNGISKIDGNPVVISFEITVTGTNVDFYGMNFQTVNHSLTITGSNNTITRCSFDVSGAGQNAVWINGGTGSSVMKSIFTSSKLHAISIQNGGSHTVDSCIVTGVNGVGIIARGTGNNTIKNCVISNVTHNGIGLISSSNIVDNCTIYNNAGAGIVVDKENVTATGNILKNNVVYGNNTSFWFSNIGLPNPDQAGIQSNGANTTIEGNQVYNNLANGILIYSNGATNSVVRNNIVGRDALGNELGNGWNGIFVWQASGVSVSNNISVNNGNGSSHATYNMPDRISGIRIQEVSSGTLSNNYVGTDAQKKSAGNAFDGITLHTNVTNVDVTGNVICNNGHTSTYGNGGGIALRNAANNNKFTANFVGMHMDLTDGGNNDYGISIEGCSGNTIGGNLPTEGNNIGYSKHTGNQGCGIWVVLSGATSNLIYNNNISFNTGDGILVERGAVGNKIGSLTQGNTITNNVNGVRVWENKLAGSTGVTNYNTVRGNSFSCNTVKGVSLSEDGNNEYGGVGTAKIVEVDFYEARATYVSGTSPANAAIDIYTADQTCLAACSDDAYQGVSYVTTVSANANGDWEYDFSGEPVLNKTNVVVMAIDTLNVTGHNSSEFSVCSKTCVAPQNITISGTNNFCLGSQTTLNADFSNKFSGNNYTYKWYAGSIDPTNLFSTEDNKSDVTVTAANTYFVVISDKLDEVNCIDQSPSFTVTTSPLPKLNLTAGTTVCLGDSVLVKSNSSGGTGTLTFAWSPGGATSDSLYVKTSGTYGVEVTDAEGCKANDSIMVTIKDTAIVNITSDTSYFCEGDSLLLTSTYKGPGSLVWQPGNETETSIFVKEPKVFTLIVTENGCTSSVAVNITKKVNPAPVLSNVSFCKGQTSLMEVDLADLEYFWSPNGETSQGITVSEEGEYFVTVTDPSTGCAASTSAFAKQNNSPIPEVDLGSDTSICISNNETVVLSMSYTGLHGGDIEWSNGESSITATYNDTTIVWVKYTDTLNCYGSDTLKINDLCAPPIMTLPNVFIPGGTTNTVFTPFGTLEASDVLNGYFIVYNRWGLKMYESEALIPSWDGKKDGQKVSNGVYFWSWEYSDTSNTKFVYNGFVQLFNRQ